LLQILEERPPTRNRQKENLPQNLAPPFFALPSLLCSRLALKDKHSCELDKIQSALVALPAVVLDMLAGWAHEAGRVVAT
jgi:hypothetical protein